MIKHQLEIRVADAEGQPVEGAEITVSPKTMGEQARAEFDPIRSLYFFDNLRPGFFELTLEHENYRTQAGRVQVHPKPIQLSFVLETGDTPYALRGTTRVPYRSEPELIGVIPAVISAVASDASTEAEDETGQTLNGLFDSLGLIPEQPLTKAKMLEEEDESEDEAGPTPLAAPGPVIVRRTQVMEDDEAGNMDLKILRNSPLVEAAGPIFHRSETSFTIFTNRLMVRFRPEVTTEDARLILREEQLSIVDELSFSPNLYFVEADASIGEDINMIAERLSQRGEVLYAEPNMAEVPEEDSIIPKDYLWAGAWDRQLVGAQDAWQSLHDALGMELQFGNPNIIIAVMDNGIKSTGGVPDNEDFKGTVSDAQGNVYEKTFKLFDFTAMLPDNDRLTGSIPDHGVACASVAAGIANNLSNSPDVGIGLSGIAPNVRLMGLISPANEVHRMEMFVWAAGLHARSRRAGFPTPIAPDGASIISCSMGFGANKPLSNTVKDMFDYITSRGRNGKGCLAFFSAGNGNSNIENERPYGSYERSFSCAASTLDANGHEARAPYSGWGKVSWCAPSNSHNPMQPHNPPKSYATWAASFLGKGNLPSFPEFTTMLTQPVQAGLTSITVNSVSNLAKNLRLLIGEPGINRSEPVRVSASPDPATGQVSVSRLLNDHNVLEEVAGGRNHHRNDFGGTSSATPLCAGIAALVLSANPDLTWIEVREILRSTAVKFDRQNTGHVGQWLDENGDPAVTSGLSPVYSQWYGYGRLDAAAAVKAALDYTFPRDLMLRKELNDSGEIEAAPSVDSPDIWVRNADPAIDAADALPLSYDKAGPHQDPEVNIPRWIYARVRNRGTEPSYDAWIRFYIASSQGMPFIHPKDWEPMNGFGNIAPDAWLRGTYFIGEVALPAVAPGDHITVNIPWPDALVPPPITLEGEAWNPHLLVEVTPHDGPLAGAQTHENNNLAEKAINIIRT